MKKINIVGRLSVMLGLFIFFSCDNPNLDEIYFRIDKLESRVDSLNLDLEKMLASVSQLQGEGKLNTTEFEKYNTLISQLNNELNNLSETETENSDTFQLEMEKIQLEIDSLQNIIDNLRISDTYQQVTGSVEKGAFISGSRFFLYELDSGFAQTGRTFTAEIEDNFGNFGLTATNLLGKNCLVLASGFYYNEVKNKNSSAPISLSGLIRIDSGEVVNVNVLTHLERLRVEHLLKNGLSYDSAKIQGLTEVLKIFGLENPGLTRAEKIGLLGSNIENDILLSISVILQGYRSESELGEILSYMAKDLEPDGILDKMAIGNSLKSHLFYMDTTFILDNLQSKYSGIFSKKFTLGSLATFERKTPYEYTEQLISYPQTNEETGKANMLNLGFKSGNRIDYFALEAYILEGMRLKIEIRDSNGNNMTQKGLGIQLGSESGNWSIGKVNGSNTGVFTCTSSGRHSLIIQFQEADNYTITYYEKNGMFETRKKTIAIR